jgi:hypothetical protein
VPRTSTWESGSWKGRLVPRGKEYTRPVGSGEPISLNPVIGAQRDKSAELDIILKSNIHKICLSMFVLPRRGRHSLQRLALHGNRSLLFTGQADGALNQGNHKPWPFVRLLRVTWTTNARTLPPCAAV